MNEKVQQYIDYVLNNPERVSEWVVKLVRRFVAEMERQGDEDFPFYFSEDEARHPLTVFEHLEFAQGRWAKTKFDLLPWQCFVLWLAYGWIRKDNGQRRYNKIYIKVPRKNGKTEFMSGIGIYGQYFDGREKDAQIYWFATKKDQAAIGFARQKRMTELLMEKSAGFAATARTLQYRIVSRKDASYTTYLGKDSKGEDGLSPFYGLCDEYHAHPNNEMMHVIESGQGSRMSPMIWIITTAGVNPDGVCARFERMCKQMLDGVIENDATLPVIYDLSVGDDWESEASWAKVNPGLGYSVSIDFLRAEYQKAKTEGVEKEMNFKVKNLNMWQKAAVVWIKAEVWNSNSGDDSAVILRDKLRGRLCFGGLDLASTKDLCSFVCVFPPEEEEGKWYVLQWTWIPEENAEKRARLDAVPYMQWVEDGDIITTPGDVTDYAYIKKTIMEVARDYDLHSVAFDRAFSQKLIPELTEEGIEMIPFSQGFQHMNGPTKAVEVMANSFQFAHGGDPVLAWAISNVSIIKDAEDRIKASKKHSKEKIDPVIALIMAVGRAGEELTEVQGRSGSVITVL